MQGTEKQKKPRKAAAGESSSKIRLTEVVPSVREEALRLAGGDEERITVESRTSVIVR